MIEPTKDENVALRLVIERAIRAGELVVFGPDGSAQKQMLQLIAAFDQRSAAVRDLAAQLETQLKREYSPRRERAIKATLNHHASTIQACRENPDA